ncbi:heme exporter protein CcmB [Marinicella sp. W31]|uniref:heme exporter protein CcmB n=1 Tax=Marinicella sp. W31 TaxID=3023713 RepID=UPI00375839FE
MKPFLSLIGRDLVIGWRRKTQIYQPLIFQLLVVTMFPLGLGAGAQLLQNIAPAVMWILALLASLLTLEEIFKNDFNDGSLEVYVLSGLDLPAAALAKATAHWLLSGLPLILFSPVIAVLLHLPAESYGILMLSLLLGTPIFSLFGAVGSALIMRQNNGGLLLCIIIMPLLTPVLIFGAGAVLESALGNNPLSHLLLLTALLILALLSLPFACSAVIKTNLE